MRAGLKENELHERSVMSNLHQVKGICSLILLHIFLEFGLYMLSGTVKRHSASSLLHYGNYNLLSNLLCFTKNCLFKIPWSIIKRAIELQNTITTARLGVALAH